METIKQVLMRRDGMTDGEADSLIEEARRDLDARLHHGEDCDDFCSDWFGLEPDYIEEFLDF